MDRARGRFSKGDSYSPRSDGSRHSHSHSNSPRDYGGQPSHSPAYPGSSRGGGSYDDRQKRPRDSPPSQSQASKRTRTEAAHGNSRKRVSRIDLDFTKPGTEKTGHGSDAARDQQIVRLKANYFQLTKTPNFVVYQYHVDIEPAIDSTTLKKGIFYDCARNLPGGKIFDGSALYLTQKLSEDTVVLKGIRKSRPRPAEGQAEPPAADTEVTVTIKFVKDLASCQDLSLFQVLNTVMRQVLTGLKLQLVGRNFFDSLAKAPVHELRVEVWPGYVTSIRQHDSSILLCCDTTSKVMRNENLYSILQNCMNVRDYKEAFMREVIGTTILTDYNNKTYRIHDIAWDQTPESTFETKKGPKTYVEYYRERYSINIRDLRQPMLISKSKGKRGPSGTKGVDQEPELIALIPELCRATGITDTMRSNFQTMRALSEITRLDPTKRVQRLQQFSRRIRDSQESTVALEKLDLHIDRDLLNIEGRMLKKPDLYFNSRSNEKTRIDRDYGNNLRNDLFRPGALDNWYVISSDRDGRSAQNFVQSIKRSVRFHISDPHFVTMRQLQKDQLSREIENIARRDPQLIMVVMPNNQADTYQLIKKKCCIDRAIPTQVVVAKTINRNNVMSIATKVAVQMSCKMGGAPWGIKIPLTGTLIIGYDVSYDTVNKSRCFGALVATMDSYQSVYYSVVSEHEEDEQLSKNFTLNVVEAIKQFRTVNEAYPTKIIIYRDGVGDGQIRHVLDHEKNPLEQQLTAMLGDAARFAFIIVNKKTNTRLFSPGDRDGYRNPQPGTIVDTGITLPERYDFYLIPTSVRQGTVSPTYFNVISDTLGLPAARLQQLTYFLCFGYYNWTDAIAVPAVCKYASKLAFLCSQHLHSAPNVWQDRRLYFL